MAASLRVLAIVAFFAAASGSKAHVPHLIHIVADDVGWNDLGMSNTDMRTPHLNTLVQDGVLLTRFYAQKECAPTRSSIMTGRLPFQYGYYSNPSDDGGVPTNYTMLPKMLRQRGYRTHAIGKWHCGFRTLDHTPTFRGFNTFLGYWHYGEEYVDHVWPPYYQVHSRCRGVDLTNATGKQLRPVLNQKGTQSSRIFVDEFARILSSHPENTPLYVYFAFQNAHDPYEKAPADLVAKQRIGLDAPRRNFSALVEDLDAGVGQVVQLLQSAGMWNDTVILFNSDNGGELPFIDQSKCNSDCPAVGGLHLCCGGAGNNYPLRGGKFGLFEGGVRVRAFIHGQEPWVPSSRRGSVWAGLSHVSDVFATVAGLAGAEISSSKARLSDDSRDVGQGNVVDSVPTDGFDLWDAIMQDKASPRKELVHQPLNVYWNGTCGHGSSPFTPSCGSAITVWPYKLLVGFPGDSRVVKIGANAATSPPARDLCTTRPCLFNIEADPSESTDLAATEPALVQTLSARLHVLSSPQDAPQPGRQSATSAATACGIVEASGAWQPWEKSDVSYI